MPEGSFDTWLEAAGGNNNGSTSEDRTNYVTDVPSNAIELALFLESDRMGYLLPTLTQSKLDGQRDVVKNEKRQRVDSAPYGQAFEAGPHALPRGPSVRWPTIGSMERPVSRERRGRGRFLQDLLRAEQREPRRGRRHRLRADEGAGRSGSAPSRAGRCAAHRSGVGLPDRGDAQDHHRSGAAPRASWNTPALFAPGDAAMDYVSNLLSRARTRGCTAPRHGYEIAQEVFAFQQSQALGSSFLIVATARPGESLDAIQRVIDEEIGKLAAAPPDAREEDDARAEPDRSLSFYRRMERTGSFGGKADQLNAYYTETGMPDYFEEDGTVPGDLGHRRAGGRAAVLPLDRRVELRVVPG
ncbi:MAG: insulinase family protein [Vicinamibacterales bacterium]